MRRLFLPILLLFFAAALSADTIFPYKYQETTLENGLKVVLVPMKNAGLVSYVTVVRAGSRDEVEPGKSGFAHFFEHMMFRGTEKYPAERYNEITSEMGADRNAFTGDDYTVYYLHFPARYLEKVIDLESDRFMNLKYPLAEFQTEAKAVLGEYNKSFANPFLRTHEKLRNVSFDKSTYRHTTIGFLKDIEDMPNQYEYSFVFFDRFYRPENCILFISGNVNSEEALALVKKYYSNWKKGNYKTANPIEPEQEKERRDQVDYPGDTLPYLALGYKIPAFAPDSREYAAIVLFSELAFGETSPLYNRLVIQEQTVDSLQLDDTPHRDPYLLTLYARLKKKDDLQKVEAAITEAIEDMKKNPVDSKKLAELKSNLKYSFLMSLDTSKSFSKGLYGATPPYIALLQGLSTIDQLFQTYESLTAEDIQKVAQNYFRTERRTVITLTGAKS